MGADHIQDLKPKRSRNIVGVLMDPPIVCQSCGNMRSIFEKIMVDTKLTIVCSECMDGILAKIAEEAVNEPLDYPLE